MNAAEVIAPTHILDRAPGLHADVPEAEYHERVLGLVSKGALEHVAKSPLHYRSWVDGKTVEEDSPALVFGRTFHCALLEPERYARHYVNEPRFGDCRKKENKAARDEWRLKNAGKVPVDWDDAMTIAGMVQSVRGHELASKMLADGVSELTALWQDQATGLRCKARADRYFAKHGMILDAKTTADASLASFGKDVFRHGYHRQAALYREGFAAAGADVRHFIFVAVEKTPPYAVATFTLDADAIAIGARQVHHAMATLAECVELDEWPGYPAGIQEITAPAWANT